MVLIAGSLYMTKLTAALSEITSNQFFMTQHCPTKKILCQKLDLETL